MLQDCENECSNNGVCRKFVCYCEPEFTGKTCQLSHFDNNNYGIPLRKAILYLYGSSGIGLVAGVIIIRYFLQKNKEKEYMKFN